MSNVEGNTTTQLKFQVFDALSKAEGIAECLNASLSGGDLVPDKEAVSSTLFVLVEFIRQARTITDSF